MTGGRPKESTKAEASGSVLVHIGLHKTGTTWLQSHLFSNPAAGYTSPWTREELLERFVLVDGLAFEAKPTREWVLERAERARGANCIPVLSHERLSGNPHSGGYDRKAIADRLFEVVPEARILIVIREQRSVIVSAYKQYVREGGGLSLSRYLQPPRRGVARIPMFSFEFFAYDRVIRYYQRRFGSERVLVLPFEELRSAAAAFVARIGRFAGARSEVALPDSRENVGLSAIGTALKRLLNRSLVRDRLNPLGWIDDERWNSALVRAIESVDRRLPSRWTESADRRMRRRVAAQVGDRYRESNRRTAGLIGSELGRFGYDV